jgi:hypothetical protein
MLHFYYDCLEILYLSAKKCLQKGFRKRLSTPNVEFLKIHTFQAIKVDKYVLGKNCQIALFKNLFCMLCNLFLHNYSYNVSDVFFT